MKKDHWREQRSRQDAEETQMFSRASQLSEYQEKTIAKLQERRSEALRRGDMSEAQDSQELLDELEETMSSPSVSSSSAAAPAAPAAETSAPAAKRGRPPGRRSNSTLEWEALQRTAARRANLDAILTPQIFPRKIRRRLNESSEDVAESDAELPG